MLYPPCIVSVSTIGIGIRKFIFGTQLVSPIKYLVILTHSFETAAILVLFFDLVPCPYRQS